MTNAYGSLHFSANLLLTLVHPTTCEDKDDWMKTSQCQSLFGCTYSFSLFHVVGKICERILSEWDCGGGCVILMSRNVFSQLFHSLLAEMSNFALSDMLTFLLNPFSLIGRSVGSIWTSLQTSLIICASITELWFLEAVFFWPFFSHRPKRSCNDWKNLVISVRIFENTG